MDVTQVQSSAGYKTLYPPAANPKTSPATDVSNIGNAASNATTKTSSSLAVNADPSTSANAEIDKYVADLKSGQSLTVIYGLQQNTALKVTNLGPVSSAGLVADPNNPNVLYRPGVVNIDPSQPAGAPETHSYNWGGYGSVQATPQPTIIYDHDVTGPPAIDEGEILILPAQDAPNEQAAQPSSKTFHTPDVSDVSIPLVDAPAASRAGLHASTDPFEAANVEVSSGWQWQPPSASTPSTSDPTITATSFSGDSAGELLQGHGVSLTTPIVNTTNASIVTINANGTETLDETSAPTTVADLSKYTTDFLGGAVVGANGAITVYRNQTVSTKSASNALDVTAEALLRAGRSSRIPPPARP